MSFKNVLNATVSNARTIVTRKYICFSGRAGRAEYWMWVISVSILSSILGLLPGKLGCLLSNILLVAIALPTLGAAVRRMHDTGRSGWVILLNIIPIIGNLIFLYFAIQPGSRGANTYGEEPAPVPGIEPHK